MTLGDRVKLLRIQKGMTQLELAQKMGYKSKTSISHIENGRDIPRAMVVTLAQLLDTTPAYLMGWENEKSDIVLPENNSSPTVKDGRSELHDDIDKLSESDVAFVRAYIKGLMAKNSGDN